LTITINDLRLTKPSIKTSIELASLLFFDIETTGLRPDRGAVITEVAILNRNSIIYHWVKNDEPFAEKSLLNLLELFEYLQQGIVIGHNLVFDFWFIAYEAERLGLDGLNLQFIDTSDLSRKLLKDHNSFKLSALLKDFDIRVDGELHTAIIDAEATRALFWKLIEVGDISSAGEAGIKKLNWSNF